MGVAYDGVPGNLAYPAALSIASSTNASPIAVTTSSPHGLLTGDLVTIAGHQVNTSANGANQTVTRSGANTFTIPVAGVGIGGATGTVQPLTYGSAPTIPSDGDPRNASSVNQAFQPLIDRSSLVLPTLGALKLAGRVLFYHNGALLSNNDCMGVAATAVANTFYAMGPGTDAIGLDNTPTEWGCLNPLPFSGSHPPLVVDGFAEGDFVQVLFQGDAVTAHYPVRYSLHWDLVPTGTSPASFPASYSQLLASSVYVNGPSGTIQQSFSMSGKIGPLLSSGTIFFQPSVFSLAITGGATWFVNNDMNLCIECWRPTGVPQ